MFKKILLFLCFLGLLFTGLYITSNYFVDTLSQRAVIFLKNESREHDITIHSIGYEDALFQLPARVYWTGVEVEFRLGEKSFLPHDRNIRVGIEKAVLALKSFKERTFRLTLSKFNISLLDSEAEGAGGGTRASLIRGRKAEILFMADLTAPGEAAVHIRDTTEKVKDFFLTGRSTLPITFAGIAAFPAGDDIFNARIFAEHRDGISTLMIDEEDVRIISRDLDLEKPLTDAEVGLVSANPLKAPRLFQIRSHARSTSGKRHRGNRDVPEDAYRHVLWSYLLAKEYGEAFARKVTDAHEAGKTGNTRAEMLMDFENNKLGFEYARSGGKESEILDFVMKDPRVVRDPGEIDLSVLQ